MSQMTEGKGFVDFMVDAEKDKSLVVEFLQYADQNELKKFFESKGYKVTPDEITKILQLKKAMASKSSLQCIEDYY